MLYVSTDVCSDHWIECQYGWNPNNVVPSTRASAEVLHIHTFLNTDKPNEFSKVTVLFLGEDNSEKENLETQSGFGVQRALTRSCFLTLLYSWCLRGQTLGAKRDFHPINSSNRQHVVLLWKLFTGQFWPFSTVKSILLSWRTMIRGLTQSQSQNHRAASDASDIKFVFFVGGSLCLRFYSWQF